jgi:hypothetical protein
MGHTVYERWWKYAVFLVVSVSVKEKCCEAWDDGE